MHPLHRAVLDAPAADEPRLVYADWLSQAGDPRGAFITAQIQLTTLPEADSRWPGAWATSQRLLAAHRARWLAPLAELAGADLADFSDDPIFCRGFVESVALWSPDTIPALCARFPLRKVCLGPAPRQYALPAIGLRRTLDNAGGEALATLPWLAMLEDLELIGSTIGARGVAALAGVAFQSLRRLSLEGANARPRGLRALEEAAWFTGLVGVDLASNHLTPDSIERLADLTELATLDLSVNPKLAGGLAAFECPRSLRDLKVRSAWGQPDIDWLSAVAGQLTRIDLSSPPPKVRPGLRNWQRLAKANWSSLTRLRISNTRAGAMLHGFIGALPHQLRRLDLSLGSLEDDAIRRLISADFDGLTHLNLSSNKLTDRAAQALGAWPGLRHVTHLNLANNRRIKADGLQALIDADGFDPVRIDVQGLVGEGPLLGPLQERFGSALQCEHANRR